MLRDLAISDLLAAFSSPDPTPGGGSAAALSSAIGASLLLMVASLPKTRTSSDDDRAALAAAAGTLAGIRDRLTAAIHEGTAAAYDGGVAACRLPKGTGDEQAARKAASQRALQAATEVPLEVMKQSAGGLEQATVVAAHGYRSASSDVGVALALLIAGTTGAKLNVDVNLGAIGDSGYRAPVVEEAWGVRRRAGTI